MFARTLRSLICGDADEGWRKKAVSGRRMVMRRFVIENIHDLSLSVATLCEKFDVSRVAVFRDFERGGLHCFLMIRRLHRALSEIAFGLAIRGRIALIAETWGFSSPAHFICAFEENSGFRPSSSIGVGVQKGVCVNATPEKGVDYDCMAWVKQ